MKFVKIITCKYEAFNECEIMHLRINDLLIIKMHYVIVSLWSTTICQLLANSSNIILISYYHMRFCTRRKFKSRITIMFNSCGSPGN